MGILSETHAMRSRLVERPTARTMMWLFACPEAKHERDKLWREWKIAYLKSVDESRFDLFPKKKEIPA